MCNASYVREYSTFNAQIRFTIFWHFLEHGLETLINFNVKLSDLEVKLEIFFLSSKFPDKKHIRLLHHFLTCVNPHSKKSIFCVNFVNY